MATQETQVLDEIIAGTRRKMLTLGGAALAGLAFGAPKAASAAAYTDADILNFALNLEYLEANFYTLAASGQTIQQAGLGIGAGTAVAPAAGAGVVTTKGGNNYASCKVPFTIPVVQAYALETAAEERIHVTLLRGALGAAAVAQPNLELFQSFATLGTAVGVPGFDPFLNDAYFLIGAYIFEDVGVTAYGGAAGLITTNSTLVTAAGILAVEAYHAGLVRTTIFNLDTAAGNLNYSNLTQKISLARATADMTIAASAGADDIGNTVVTTPLNNASTTAKGITLADVNLTTSLAYTRSTTQVLQIVTYPQGTATPFKGGFFPQGLNGGVFV